jgi:hypothetical protein
MLKSMIKYIIIALLLGCSVTVLIMQRDPWVLQVAGEHVKAALAQAGCCQVHGTTEHLNLLYPYVELTDVTVTPCTGHARADWYWTAKRLRAYVSWWHLLMYGTLELAVELDDVVGASRIDCDRILIFDHIKALTRDAPTALPVILQSLNFNRATCTITHEPSAMLCKLSWQSESRRIGNAFKSSIYVLDGSLTYNDRTYLEHVRGTAHMDMYACDYAAAEFHVDLNAAADVPQLSEKERTCFVVGQWHKNQGSFVVNNAERTVVIEPLEIVSEHGVPVARMKMTFPCHYLLRLLLPKSAWLTDALSGECHGQAECAIPSGIDKVQGALTAHNITYQGMPCPLVIQTSFARDARQWRGGIVCDSQAAWHSVGSWGFDEQHESGFVALMNKDEFSVPGFASWSVRPRECSLRITKEKQNFSGGYTCKAVQKEQDKNVVLKGTFKADAQAFTLAGSVQDMRYDIAGICEPKIRLHKALCKNDQGVMMLEMRSLPHDDNRLQGQVSMPLMHALVSRAFGVGLQGEGTFDVRMLLGDTVTTKIHLSNGTIRLPYTYNFISGFDAVLDFDQTKRAVTLTNLACTLHRGEFTCDQGLVHFDAAYHPSFIHMPLLLNHCLLNVNKDLFANVSGRVLLSKKEEQMPLLKGQLILEQAQLKENILSHVLQKDIGLFAGNALIGSGADLGCDLSIKTKEPVRVKTAFLETKAKIDLSIKNSIRSPEVSGAIDLMAGTLLFPYRPLYITKGSIHFVANQLNDPRIELIAKNKVKKYNITLSVLGSLLNHSIMLQASPPLTEEQIVALLLAGSQADSLNSAMPALIMNNLGHLIFARDHENRVERYFRNLLIPLKHIHLVPSFTDQTGRGGLRGAIEIDVNDRWRALIQKNFSLSEDTRFELEYLVSDDISIRGIRDERRDLGGEVEMRWKF